MHVKLLSIFLFIFISSLKLCAEDEIEKQETSHADLKNEFAIELGGGSNSSRYLSLSSDLELQEKLYLNIEFTHSSIGNNNSKNDISSNEIGLGMSHLLREWMFISGGANITRQSNLNSSLRMYGNSEFDINKYWRGANIFLEIAQTNYRQIDSKVAPNQSVVPAKTENLRSKEFTFKLTQDFLQSWSAYLSHSRYSYSRYLRQQSTLQRRQIQLNDETLTYGMPDISTTIGLSVKLFERWKTGAYVVRTTLIPIDEIVKTFGFKIGYEFEKYVLTLLASITEYENNEQIKNMGIAFNF